MLFDEYQRKLVDYQLKRLHQLDNEKLQEALPSIIALQKGFSLQSACLNKILDTIIENPLKEDKDATLSFNEFKLRLTNLELKLPKALEQQGILRLLPILLEQEAKPGSLKSLGMQKILELINKSTREVEAVFMNPVLRSSLEKIHEKVDIFTEDSKPDRKPFSS